VAKIMPILLSDLDHIDFSDIEDEAAARIAPIHPGEILRTDWLEPMGITPYRAATDMGVPPNRVTAILSGKRGITADTALRLARYFGTDAQSWINLQAQYDLEVAALVHGAEIARSVKPRSAA
jgi:antitoxin HigA-1